MIPSSPSPVDVIVAPHRFNIIEWEIKNFWQQPGDLVAADFCRGYDTILYSRTNQGLVESPNPTKSRYVQELLAQSIIDSGFSGVFPPLRFSIESAPLILIVSPRANISLEDTMLLDSSVSVETMIQVEENIEALTDKSVLIDKLGGLGVYPSIIDDHKNLSVILNTASHEWIHHRLILTPLGRRYFSSAFIKELNENVAQLAGNELGDKSIAHIPFCSELNTSLIINEDVESYRILLGETRKNVEIMLEAGKITEAENYMEMQRRKLADQGYAIRKINQAYYAFYGLYGDDPVSTSGIFKQLEHIRGKTNNLDSFLALIGEVKNEEQFETLVREYQ